MKQVNEEVASRRLQNVSKQAEQLYDRYRPQMDLLEKSTLCKVRGSLQPQDVYALGKQLEQWDDYKAMCEEEGNLNLLGKIPTVAYDVITAVHGASVIPIIASVQPIEEERGIIYFKTVRAANTKGAQTAGQTLVDPRVNVVTPQGYANNSIVNESDAVGDGTTKVFTFTVAALPVRSETLKVSVQGDATTYGQDVGPSSGSDVGQILGAGVYGTVNYVTGVVNLTFNVAPANLANIYTSYQQNFELSTDIPQIDTFFASQTIQAKIYALKGTIGLIQSFGMRKRFGLVAEDELAKDLVQEINIEIGGDLIRQITATAVSSFTFDRQPPANVSYFEHKQTYKDAIAMAERNLAFNAGRGTISVMIAGSYHCSLIQTLPGFVKLTDGNTLGAHVFGTLDGVTVIRVLDQNLLDAATCLCLWRGTSPFETNSVYAPFMPLTMTNTLPQAPNPLQTMRAAAVWAGVASVVPQYATTLLMTNPTDIYS